MSGWLAEYGGKLIGGLATLLASSVVVEIVPIKICPWTAFFRWVGKKINGDVREKLDEISNDLSTHIHEDNQRNAKRARVRILRFADEILEDITEYNRYCARHPEFPNDKATLSIAHIERVYRARLEKNDFL